MSRTLILAVTSLFCGSVFQACSRGSPQPGATQAPPAPSKEGGAPWPPPITLRSLPGDLETNYGAQPIGLILSYLTGTVPDAGAMSGAIASSFELHRMADGSVVDGDVSVVALNLPAKDYPQDQQSIEFHPKQPLADGWYGIVLKNLPQRVTPRFGWFTTGLPGDVVARFDTASYPTIGKIRICPKGGGTVGRMVVELSEKVVEDAASVPSAIQVHRSGTQCSFVSGGPVAAGFFFDCPWDSVGFDAPWSVQVEPGVKAPGGRGLSTLDGATSFSINFVPSQLNEDAEHCRDWLQTPGPSAFH